MSKCLGIYIINSQLNLSVCPPLLKTSAPLIGFARKCVYINLADDKNRLASLKYRKIENLKLERFKIGPNLRSKSVANERREILEATVSWVSRHFSFWDPDHFSNSPGNNLRKFSNKIRDYFLWIEHKKWKLIYLLFIWHTHTLLFVNALSTKRANTDDSCTVVRHCVQGVLQHRFQMWLKGNSIPKVRLPQWTFKDRIIRIFSVIPNSAKIGKFTFSCLILTFCKCASL